VIPAAKALRLILARTRPMPSMLVRLPEADGRITIRDVRAPFALPRFTASSMDGYALSSRATKGATRARPVRLRLRQRAIFAGSNPGPRVAPDAAVRIMTGAPLPTGVDAVLPQEEARLEGGALLVTRPVRAGRNVRRAAEDCRRGDVVVPKGTRLQPGAIALLSILGLRRVEVRRAPRVAIVVTGSEVRPPGARALPDYAVHDASAAFLTSALKEWLIAPSCVIYVRDRDAEIRAALTRALARADLVIVTGGVSVGERDLVRPALASLGARTIFWGVAQKPGKPLYFGERRGVKVLGLPGNPASTVVCYCEYVRPALRAMLGEPRSAPEAWTARLAAPVARIESKTQFLRGRMEESERGWQVSVDRRQGSNLLRSFLGNDCLVVVPPGSGPPLAAGSRVRVHPLPWRRA